MWIRYRGRSKAANKSSCHLSGDGDKQEMGHSDSFIVFQKQYYNKYSRNDSTRMRNEACRTFLFTESKLNTQISQNWHGITNNEPSDANFRSKLVNSFGGEADWNRLVKHRIPLMESIVPVLKVFQSNWSVEENRKITAAIKRFHKNRRLMEYVDSNILGM